MEHRRDSPGAEQAAVVSVEVVGDEHLGRPAELVEDVEDGPVAAADRVAGGDAGFGLERPADSRAHRRVQAVGVGHLVDHRVRRQVGHRRPEAGLALLLAVERRAARASPAPDPGAAPSSSRGTPRSHRPRGCPRRRTPPAGWLDRSVTKVMAGMRRSASCATAAATSGWSGALRMTPSEPRSAIRSRTAAAASGSLCSLSWARLRSTAGRSEASSASSAWREAVENRSGACMTRSSRSVRPDSDTWLRCRSSSATASSTWATVSARTPSRPCRTRSTVARLSPDWAAMSETRGRRGERATRQSVSQPRSVGHPVAVPSSPFTLAVCVEMVLRDLPLADRIRHVHDLGFAVEIWDWTAKDLDELAGLAESGVRFTSMTGYVDGELIDPRRRRGAARLGRAFGRGLAPARRAEPQPARHRARRRRPAGAAGRGGHRRRCGWRPPKRWSRWPSWAPARASCSRLENLNTEVDHPGTPFARAADTRALVAAVAARTCG